MDFASDTFTDGRRFRPYALVVDITWGNLTFIESFNVRFRDECLNVSVFSLFRDAPYERNRWRDDFNQIGPYSVIENLSAS